MTMRIRTRRAYAAGATALVAATACITLTAAAPPAAATGSPTTDAPPGHPLRAASLIRPSPSVMSSRSGVTEMRPSRRAWTSVPGSGSVSARP